MLFLKILGGILALGFGIYLGRPGEFKQTPEEIEESLGVRRASRKVSRYFTPLDWIRAKERGSDRRRGETRQPFKMD